jgi:hypothetical protein
VKRAHEEAVKLRHNAFSLQGYIVGDRPGEPQVAVIVSEDECMKSAIETEPIREAEDQDIPDALMEEITHENFDIAQMDMIESDSAEDIQRKKLMKKIHAAFNMDDAVRIKEALVQAKLKGLTNGKAKGKGSVMKASSPYARKQ